MTIGFSIENLVKEIMQVVTEKREIVSLDESKLMAHFGIFGWSEF